MKNSLPWIVAALFLLLALYFYWQKVEAENRLVLLEQDVVEAGRELAQEEAPEDSLVAAEPSPEDEGELVPPGGAAFVDELGTLSESDIQRLERKGLENPEVGLKNDLNQKQSKLIPTDGVLGGTMRIRDSRILNDRYALAYYEDGHIAGYMLLKYEVNNGNINWTVLDNTRL
ncbi:hypothetical protein [Pontibacter ummariensis]|nr:hypothetical protein [Pontibacter ummariensis]